MFHTLSTGRASYSAAPCLPPWLQEREPTMDIRSHLVSLNSFFTFWNLAWEFYIWEFTFYIVGVWHESCIWESRSSFLTFEPVGSIGQNQTIVHDLKRADSEVSNDQLIHLNFWIIKCSGVENREIGRCHVTNGEESRNTAFVLILPLL